jgi:hypothetical protein
MMLTARADLRGGLSLKQYVLQPEKTANTDLWPNPSIPKNGEFSAIKRFLLFNVRPYIYCFHPAEPKDHLLRRPAHR